MSKKILNLQCDILVLTGIILALRLIFTKDIYMQVGGYTVNILVSLIHTIVLVGLYRQMDKKMIKETKSHN